MIFILLLLLLFSYLDITKKTAMDRAHRVGTSWRVRDCGVVTASRKGAVGALWMDCIGGVWVVFDKLGREALEIECTMAGASHVVIAEYLPAGVLPPEGLASEIAAAWARTKADMDALARCTASSGGL